MGCLIETKMTFIPQGHTSLSRKQKKVTYGAKVHTASLCCFAVRRAIATHTCDAALAIISPPIRSGPSQASPDLCPCDPRRSPEVKQVVPTDKNLNHWSSYIEKKGQQSRGYKQSRGGLLSTPPCSPSLALMRPFLSPITSRACVARA